MDEPRGRVLIVEDSTIIGPTIRSRFEKELPYEVTLTQTYGDTERLLQKDHDPYFVAILDMDLPDAPHGEIVDLVQSKHIPVVVFTAGVSHKLRKELWRKHVVDYVAKDSTSSLDYLIALIQRLGRNQDIGVLVVDDSPSARRIVCGYLEAHRYTVYGAGDGEEALGLLEAHPNIKLVLTDYNMPRMDGVKLTKRIRSLYGRDELAVIGVSSGEESALSASFLKSGANDFIRKPFEAEEFYCRITQNVENLELIAQIREVSNTDFLTGLPNRRFFFETGRKLLEASKRGNRAISVVMVDVDHFKAVNDTYGHDAGDEVLKRLSEVLKSRFRKSDLVCRLGGEEFCAVITNSSKEAALTVVEDIRQTVEQEVVNFGDEAIRITVSAGLTDENLESLDDMVGKADKLLYQAKESGRNRVVIDES